MYVGGAEHSVLHLLYVRFLSMALHDIGVLDFPAQFALGGSGREEPFKKFFAHGLIIKDGAKMSKSKGNVVNPDEYIKKYGADALRMYLMFLGPFEQGGDFRDSGVCGITRFLQRVWILGQKTVTGKIPNSKIQMSNKFQNPNVKIKIHKTIKKVTEDIENLQYNTAISALMILLNEFEDSALVGRADLEIFIKLLAPFAPHITEEIWQKTRNSADINADKRGKDRRKSAFKSIHISAWPKYDQELVKENEVDIVVQVNGKTRGVIKAPTGVSQSETEKLARADENISRHLAGKVKKVIFVRNKLMNFVTI